MGAWGAGSYENDDALDWVWRLDDLTDYSAVVAKLETVTSIDADEYLESFDGTEALAAAESVAVAAGRPPAGELPESVSNWVARIDRPPTAEELALARLAVERVRTPQSELLELWQEADEAEWIAAVSDLENRLGE